MKPLHQRIKERRESLELSQTDVANGMGMSPAIISHYETGSREPSLTALRMLASALRCKVSDLIDDIQEPPMVLCPTCCGRGVLPKTAADGLQRLREQAILDRIAAIRRDQPAPTDLGKGEG